jgi:Fe-S cluster assembly ATP-binding protein
MSLKIKNLKVAIAETDETVIEDASLEVEPGQVHVIMGPNGSGKSSLSKVIMGHPDYEVAEGEIFLDDEEITEDDPDERAHAGLFLASQYPVEIPGVNLTNYLRMAYNAVKDDDISLFKFRKLLREKLEEANLPESFMKRNLNEGFSGGEKKKCEILQMLVLEPRYAILDETDSGLDVDAIRTVFTSLAEAIENYKEMGVVMITHYHRLFEYIKPDKIHVLVDGKIVETGGMKLAEKIEAEGYKAFKKAN